MLNRTQQPDFLLPQKLEIPVPQKYFLEDGREVLWLNIGTQDIVRVTLQFPAGTKYQSKSLQASSSVGLISEGTKSFSAQEVAEKLDFYGSHIDYSIDRDHAVISAFCLSKYLKPTLEILKEIVLYPAYKEDEFETYCQKRRSSMLIEKQKVMYVAREQQAAALFGRNSPYGSFAEADDYDALSVDDLRAYHNERFLKSGALLFISGLVNEETVSMVAQEFNSVIRTNTEDKPLVDLESMPAQQTVFIPKDDAVQSAVRFGRVLFPRSHPDYSGMFVLSTILGGYFGSRLMTNIREDKGYTYGIFSSFVSLQEVGYLTIATEVGCAVTQPTIDEIVKEMELLRRERVEDDELELVVNYLVGDMLRMLDGPFSIVDAILELQQSGLPVSFISEHFDRVLKVSAEEIYVLAQKYLNPEDFTKVIVGKMN